MYRKISNLSLLLLVSSLLLWSCKSGDTSNTKQQNVIAYNVIALKKNTATLYEEYPARLQGIQDIDIRPKIDGYIEKVLVDEGQEVRRGQALFTINNPQFGQEVNNTLAAIKSAEAAVATAQLQVQKTQPLVEQEIISAYELENAKLNLKAKEASLAQAKAIHNNAKTNQGYTTVTSPVNGVVGLLPYRVGSYVNSATAQPLTTISDISTVYAYFSINEKTQLSLINQSATDNIQQMIKNLPPVEMLLSNGNLYNEKGKIETFSGQVNTQTGSFNVRASFKNAEKILRSGSSVTVRIPTMVTNAIIIPQNATTELQNKRLAYILDSENKVKAVPIIVRAVPGGQYFVVDSGLSENDKLIVEGIGILTEGTLIQPNLINTDSVLKL